MPQGFLSRQWVLVACCLAMAAALAGGWAWHHLRVGRTSNDTTLQGLQVFGTLPEFSLVERDRRRVSRADLLGSVWVANFIYTRCTDTCPLQSASMAALQRDFPGDRRLRFLSITVDPKRDTPTVLAEYAVRYDADRERWWFLTGDKQAIYALIREGFRLSVDDPTDSAAPAQGVSPRLDQTRGGTSWPARRRPRELERTVRRLLEPSAALAHSDSDFLAPPFIHSSWFVLGDRQARIRGYYRTEDERALRQLRRDLRVLLAEG